MMRDQAKKRPRTSLQQRIFSIAAVLSCFIVLPYAYYAMAINKYAHANKSDDVLFPEYSGFFNTFAAAIGFNVYRKMLHIFLTPIVLIFLVPEKDEDGEILSTENKQEVAKKIVDHVFDASIYGSFAIWAWDICKGQEWFPWHLGGSGDIINATKNFPFIQVTPGILSFGFINFGYRVEGLYMHVAHH